MLSFCQYREFYIICIIGGIGWCYQEQPALFNSEITAWIQLCKTLIAKENPCNQGFSVYLFLRCKTCADKLTTKQQFEATGSERKLIGTMHVYQYAIDAIEI